MSYLKRLQWVASRQWALGGMLMALHGVLVSSPNGAWVDALMMTHYGLFLLWQPVWRGEQKLNLISALLFISGGGILLFFMSWWTLVFWMSILIGLLGGRLFSARDKSERMATVIAVTYLLCMLLLWVEPHLLMMSDVISNGRWLVYFGLPILPMISMAMKNEGEHTQAMSLDFFYGLMMFFLVVILVLGSFIIETVTKGDYALVLMRAVFGIAAMLIILSLFWNPRAGFSGVGQLLSRYLLSVGMPFEVWLQSVALLAESSKNAHEFLTLSSKELLALPWVSGGTWETDQSHEVFGEVSPNVALFSYHGLQLTLYTRHTLNPAMTLHVKLLAQLLGEFYEAKVREEQLKTTAYLQAIYETGARLTHDIKNLLQSLKTLCSIAEKADSSDQTKLVALIQRQLPQLTQRLQTTLEKLQTPAEVEVVSALAEEWWHRLQVRYRETSIIFKADTLPDKCEIPVELFDSVSDNLLQNALEKARLQSGLNIHVTMFFDQAVGLLVEDDGTPVPSDAASKMFRAPLNSASGFGIGLFQAGRQATQLGYDLKLVSNLPGAVRFELRRILPHSASTT